MRESQCPYCGEEVEINHDDGYGYEEAIAYQQECGSCEKTFVFYTSISFHYETRKADCLNGDSHSWRPTQTYPKYMASMECEMCDETRPPTEQEKIKYQIPDWPALTESSLNTPK